MTTDPTLEPRPASTDHAGPAWLERRPALVLSVAMLLATGCVWAAFAGDLTPLYRYWDGPLYVYAAKTLYQIPVDHPFVGYRLEPSYFALYFPPYPLLIRALSLVTGGQYPAAMLLATALCSVAAVLLFYRVLCEYDAVASPAWTALLFCVLPPRWLLYHSVGATEPLFLCFVFATFLAHRRGRAGWVAVFIALASITRIQGVLLGPVFLLVYGQRRDWRSLAWLPLGAVGILALFGFHQIVFGDFFAYFRWQGQHLQALPFGLYRAAAERSNPDVTEFYFWTYFVYAVGTLALWRQRALFFHCLVFSVFTSFLYINDVARMFVPVAPFALLVGFDPVLRLPAVRWLLPLVALGAVVYAVGIVPHNGVADPAWTRLLVELGR